MRHQITKNRNPLLSSSFTGLSSRFSCLETGAFQSTETDKWLRFLSGSIISLHHLNHTSFLHVLQYEYILFLNYPHLMCSSKLFNMNKPYFLSLSSHVLHAQCYHCTSCSFAYIVTLVPHDFLILHCVMAHLNYSSSWIKFNHI